MTEKPGLSRDITRKNKRTARLGDQLRANLKRRKAARDRDVAVEQSEAEPPEAEQPEAASPEAAKIPYEERS